MIKIFIDKEENEVEIKGTTLDVIAELATIIHIMNTDDTLSALYPAAKYFQERCDFSEVHTD